MGLAKRRHYQTVARLSINFARDFFSIESKVSAGSIMKIYQKIIASIVFSLLFTLIAAAQPGGMFEITQAVISNGGGSSGGANFNVTGTTAQTFAGMNSTNGQYGVRGGFWQSFFAPTAAMVSLNGLVLSSNGGGISKARVTLTSAGSETRTAATSSFGYFRFDDVEVGQTYIISVSSKGFYFANGTQVLVVNDEINDLVFIALP